MREDDDIRTHLSDLERIRMLQGVGPRGIYDQEKATQAIASLPVDWQPFVAGLRVVLRVLSVALTESDCTCVGFCCLSLRGFFARVSGLRSLAAQAFRQGRAWGQSKRVRQSLDGCCTVNIQLTTSKDKGFKHIS